MTPLEFIGIGGLIAMAMSLVKSLRKPAVAEEFGKAIEEQLHASLREAFEAGVLAAADMVTMSGEEELAGKLRKVVEQTKVANDN
jgi:serine/threonine protein kinase HipA of HipAB toxin-antitoxin module